MWHSKRFTPSESKAHVQCLACGRDLYLPKSKVALYRTCGGACNRALKAARIQSRSRNCETCGIAFIPREYQLAHGQGRFCSQKFNTPGQQAINSPEAQVRARMAWRATYSIRPFAKVGPANPKWKGGRAAMHRRRVEAGVYREANHRRRCRLKGKVSPKEIQSIAERQRWKCALCTKCVRRKYHIDHIFPISKGGLHEALNIQILCPTCNIRKGAKHPIQFAQAMGRLL